MRIESGIASLFSLQKISSSTASSAASSTATTGSASSAVSDTVTLSAAAKAAVAQTSSGYDAALRSKTIREAEQDPRFGAQTAYEYAHDTFSMTGPFVNINTDPMTYSATGEVVTPENLAAFKAEAASATASKIAVYNAEKAKGTPDSEILKKLYAVTNAQPDGYLSKVGWVRDATGSLS